MKKNELYFIHGSNYKEMTKHLLKTMDLQSEIGDKSQTIAIKPNLVIAAPASRGATTHPEIVAGVIEYLQENGFHNLKVIEGSWVGDQTSVAVKTSGILDVCDCLHVPFYDLQKDSSTAYDANGIVVKLCNHVTSSDYLINIPVMKGHCQTAITCALKNAKGLIPNSEKRRFHTLGLHKPIAHLNTVLPRNCVIVDNICGDLDFEEGGNPVQMNRIFSCLDPVLCDTFVCQSIGYSLTDVPYIIMAEQLGVGSTNLANANIVMLNAPSSTTAKPTGTRRVQKLARHVCANNACSACYGSLIYALNKLDSEGHLRNPSKLIYIGQAWKNTSGDIGVGSCTKYFSNSLAGCPPTAIEIYRFLKNLL